MNIQFQDMTECSIEFESQNSEEKQLIRDIYLVILNQSPEERINLLKKIVNEDFK